MEKHVKKMFCSLQKSKKQTADCYLLWSYDLWQTEVLI